MYHATEVQEIHDEAVRLGLPVLDLSKSLHAQLKGLIAAIGHKIAENPSEEAFREYSDFLHRYNIVSQHSEELWELLLASQDSERRS